MNNTPRLDLIVFGGSFDPPHLGHVETVRLVREHFPDTRILILPAAAPARARGDNKPGPAASFTHRLAMCRLAFAGEVNVEICDLEAALPPPNYTVRTLSALLDQVPARRLGWVLGADQLRAFPRWHDPQRILCLAHLIVLPRAEDALCASDVAAILASTGADAASAVTILHEAPPPYASREIRAAVKNRRPVEGLPPAVVAYIEDQHLYSEEEADGAT